MVRDGAVRLLTMRAEICRRWKSDMRHRPCSLRPGGAGLLLSPSAKTEGDGAPGSASSWMLPFGRHSLARVRAGRRSIAAISDHGPGFLGRGRRLSATV